MMPGVNRSVNCVGPGGSKLAFLLPLAQCKKWSRLGGEGASS